MSLARQPQTPLRGRNPVARTISVLALGNWGTALGNHLARAGNTVIGWSHDQEIVRSINQKHRNPSCLTDTTLASTLRATTDLNEALQAELVLLAFPSHALGEMVPKICTAACAGSSVFLSVIKGFESSSLKTPLQLLANAGVAPERTAVLSGPSFARDIVIGKPAGVVVASASAERAQEIAALFTGPTFKAYTSTDPLGVELGGSIKNVIALAVGISDGLGLGDSARGGLITRGLAEMTRLARALGAEERTLFGLSGLGDLVMTSTCDTSRNRTVGLRLGRGEELSAIVKAIGSAVEGVTTAPLVLKLAQERGIEMPITEQVTLLVAGKTSAAAVTRALLSRPVRSELD